MHYEKRIVLTALTALLPVVIAQPLTLTNAERDLLLVAIAQTLKLL